MTFYFTFGADHKDPITRESMARKFLAVPGDIEQSRRLMLFFYGRKWASQYPSKREAGVERYNLTPATWPYALACDDYRGCGCIEVVYQYTETSPSEYLYVGCAQHPGIDGPPM